MVNQRTRVLVLLAAVGIALAGCDGETGGNRSTAPTAPPSQSSSPSARPAPTPSETVITDPPGSVDPPPGSEVLTGRVVEAEVGCRVLETLSGSWTLIVKGDAAKVVKIGATVTVTGHSDPNLATTCQVGIPFIVTSATARR